MNTWIITIELKNGYTVEKIYSFPTTTTKKNIYRAAARCLGNEEKIVSMKVDNTVKIKMNNFPIKTFVGNGFYLITIM